MIQMYRPPARCTIDQLSTLAILRIKSSWVFIYISYTHLLPLFFGGFGGTYLYFTRIRSVPDLLRSIFNQHVIYL